MNSGDLKTYEYVKISKSNFFTITILPLHTICSESKKEAKENEDGILNEYSAILLNVVKKIYFKATTWSNFGL